MLSHHNWCFDVDQKLEIKCNDKKRCYSVVIYILCDVSESNASVASSMHWLCMYSLNVSCAWCDCGFSSDRRKFASSKLLKSYQNKTIFMAVGGLFVWLSAHSSAVNLRPWHLFKHLMGIFTCLLCCAFQYALSEASHVLKIGFDSSVAMTASCC